MATAPRVLSRYQRMLQGDDPDRRPARPSTPHRRPRAVNAAVAAARRLRAADRVRSR